MYDSFDLLIFIIVAVYKKYFLPVLNWLTINLIVWSLITNCEILKRITAL